jgi:hypothetical protein
MPYYIYGLLLYSLHIAPIRLMVCFNSIVQVIDKARNTLSNYGLHRKSTSKYEFLREDEKASRTLNGEISDADQVQSSLECCGFGGQHPILSYTPC